MNETTGSKERERVNTIGVLGAGVMGTGIAQLAAQAGYTVILRDLKQSLLKEGLKTVRGHLEQQVEAGLLTADEKEAVIKRIHGSTDLADMAQCDIVIEAVVENMAVKKQLFAELDAICPAHTILASTTASLSITEIAAYSNRSQQVMGLHFQNPVPDFDLVEIIRGIDTSDASVDTARELITRLGKQYIVVNRDYPGYVVNRILMTYINEAIHLVGEGAATAADIDSCMRLGAGMSEGPLQMADRLGLDVVYANLTIFCQEYRDFKYRTHPRFNGMIRAGQLGRKSGQGFYSY